MIRADEGVWHVVCDGCGHTEDLRDAGSFEDARNAAWLTGFTPRQRGRRWENLCRDCKP